MNKKVFTIISVIIFLVFIGTLVFGWHAGWFSKKDTTNKEQRLAQLNADPSSIVLSDKYKFDQVVGTLLKYRSGDTEKITDADRDIYFEIQNKQKEKILKSEPIPTGLDKIYSLYDSNGESIDLGMFQSSKKITQVNLLDSSDLTNFTPEKVGAAISGIYDKTKDIDKTSNFYNEIDDDPFAGTIGTGYNISIDQNISVKQMTEILSSFAAGDVRYITINYWRLNGLPNSNNTYSIEDELNSAFTDGIIVKPRIQILLGDLYGGPRLKIEPKIFINDLLAKIQSITKLTQKNILVNMSSNAGFSFKVYSGGNSPEKQVKIQGLLDSLITEIGKSDYNINFNNAESVAWKMFKLTDFNSLKTAIEDAKKNPIDSFNLQNLQASNINYFEYYFKSSSMVADFNKSNPDIKISFSLIGGGIELDGLADSYFTCSGEPMPCYALFSPYIPRAIINELNTDFFPLLKKLVGNSARNKRVKVVFDNTEKDNAGYMPYINRVGVSQGLLNSSDTYIHELTHSMFGEDTYYLPGFLNEGTTTTVTEYILDKTDSHLSYVNRVYSAYTNSESLNLPQIVFQKKESDNSYLSKPLGFYYQWGANLISKLYLEDSQYFKNYYNTSFAMYSLKTPAEQKIIQRNDMAQMMFNFEVIKKCLSKIEGIDAGSWLNNQFYLFSSTSGNMFNSVYLEGRQKDSYPRMYNGAVYKDIDTAYLYSQNLKLKIDSMWEVKILNFSEKIKDKVTISLYGQVNNKEVEFGQTIIEKGDLNSDQVRRGFKPIIISRQNFSRIPADYSGSLRFNIATKSIVGSPLNYNQYFYSSDNDTNVVAVMPGTPNGTLVKLEGQILDKCTKVNPADKCLRNDIDSGKISTSAIAKNGLAVFTDTDLANPGKFTINFERPKSEITSVAGQYEIKNEIVSKTFNKINGEYVTIIYPEVKQCSLGMNQEKTTISFWPKETACSSSTKYTPTFLFKDKTGVVKEKCALGQFCIYNDDDSLNLKVDEYFYPKDLQLIK